MSQPYVPRAVPIPFPAVNHGAEPPPVGDCSPSVPTCYVTKFTALEYVATGFQVLAAILVIDLIVSLVILFGGAFAALAKAAPEVGASASVVALAVGLALLIGHVISILFCLGIAELLKLAIRVCHSVERTAHYTKWTARGGG